MPAHAAVKHELLVRYLDAWTPAVLHGHRRVTYLECPAGESAVAASRVFGEFADVIAGRTLVMLLGPSPPAPLLRRVDAVLAEYGRPEGLTVQPYDGPVVPALRQAGAVGMPIFALLGGLVDPEELGAVAANRSTEILATVPPSAPTAPLLAAIQKAGLDQTAWVELVDLDGVTESLIFATSAEKALEKFKDELWALDEYAGIRYRDPSDAEQTLLDISLQPNLRPLRRALLARVSEDGGGTLAELRKWVVHATIYRSVDATKAVQALVAAGEVERSPASGRLSPSTIIRPVSR